MQSRKEVNRDPSESVWVATLHAGVDLNEANLLHDIRAALDAGDETTR